MLRQRRNSALMPKRTTKKNEKKYKLVDGSANDHDAFDKNKLCEAKLLMVQEELEMSREQHALAIAERKQRMKNEQNSTTCACNSMESHSAQRRRIRRRRLRRRRRRLRRRRRTSSSTSNSTTTTDDSRWEHEVRSDIEASPPLQDNFDV